MFKEGFEKVAILTGTAIGALAGGERDKKTGGKKNRAIGALRGGLTEAGMGLGSLAGGTLGHLTGRRHLRAQDFDKYFAHRGIGAALGIVPGAVAAYKLSKKYGPKYEHEAKKK